MLSLLRDLQENHHYDGITLMELEDSTESTHVTDNGRTKT